VHRDAFSQRGQHPNAIYTASAIYGIPRYFSLDSLVGLSLLLPF
jgi:hypothetical protein